LPVRGAASAWCASEHSSGLACARAFGFPGSWDLDLLLPCHTQVLACVEKGASCNSNDADDAQVIITAVVAAQPKRRQGTGGRAPNGWAPIRHPSFCKYLLQGPFSKGQGEKVRATWGLRCRTNSPICALQPTSMTD
jgi:hypothetical protein